MDKAEHLEQESSEISVPQDTRTKGGVKRRQKKNPTKQTKTHTKRVLVISGTCKQV